MAPALWPGDIVTVQRRLFRDIVAGEIVVFRRKGRLVGHRMVRYVATGDALVTRGDYCRIEDDPVSRHDILGVVVRIRRCGHEFVPGLDRSRLPKPAGWLLRYFAIGRRIAFRLRRSVFLYELCKTR
jgi:hypothetical protein